MVYAYSSVCMCFIFPNHFCEVASDPRACTCVSLRYSNFLIVSQGHVAHSCDFVSQFHSSHSCCVLVIRIQLMRREIVYVKFVVYCSSSPEKFSYCMCSYYHPYCIFCAHSCHIVSHHIIDPRNYIHMRYFYLFCRLFTAVISLAAQCLCLKLVEVVCPF